MKKYNVELVYGIGFTINDIVAETKEQAIEKAKQIVENETTVMGPHGVNEGNLEYDQCSFIEEV